MERNKYDIGGNRPPSKSRQDYDDLQNEMAGRDVGRIARFIHEDRSPHGREKRAEKERASVSRLMALLQSDPEYARLYNDTMDKLGRAETATQAALESAEQRLAGAERDLADMRDRASTLPDGTKVFRGKDGNVYTEDGRQLTDDERSQVDWKEGAPRYDEFAAKKKEAVQARTNITDLQRYQTDVLGRIRDRMEDEQQPPSKDEFDSFDKDMKDQMPSAAKNNITPSNGPALDSSNGVSAITLPPMKN